jgi:DNA polymerase III subunit epsilon
VLTGSELVALLKESIDIKTLNPVFNRAQRRSISRYGLYSFTDDNGYLQLSIKRNSDSSEAPFLCFNSAKSARAILFKWVEEYQLCQKLCGLYESAGACFSYSLGECNGACIGEEAASVYNQRVKNLLKKYSLIDNSMFLMEQGRDTLEMAVIKIEHGKYMGYGYINTAFANSMDDLNDCINPYEDNRETRMIIRQYLEKNQHKMRIVYV